MTRNTLVAAAMLLFGCVTAMADPGGRPNAHATKKAQEQTKDDQGAPNWRILFVGGYRQQGMWSESERWREEKARKAGSDKAARERDAHARQDREESRRIAAKDRQEREKADAVQRRDAEKGRQAEKDRARVTQETERRREAQFKQNREQEKRQVAKRGDKR